MLKLEGSNHCRLPDARDERRRGGKPPYSYVSLIVMAILESPNQRQTLRGIIDYIQKRFTYYNANCPTRGWKNSIRHNLSLNECFEKTIRDPRSPSKGHYWRLHPRSVNMFEGGSFMRRKTRFRKDFHSAKEGNSRPLYGDVTNKTIRERGNISRQNDVTMTSPYPVSSMSYHDYTASNVLTTNVIALLPDDLRPQHPCHKNNSNVQDTPCKGRTTSLWLPSSFSSSFCLVCAGCTCYY